jgi:hypothetical protein
MKSEVIKKSERDLMEKCRGKHWSAATARGISTSMTLRPPPSGSCSMPPEAEQALKHPALKPLLELAAV